MSAAKQSAIDKLHRCYVAQLQLQLQVPDPSPAMLSVIGTFLAKSGTKAVNDSPKMQALAKSWTDLPFRSDDTPSLPGPRQKDHE
jgi:hypothetical protein